MPTLPLMAFTSLRPASRSIPRVRFFVEKEQSSPLTHRKHAAAPKTSTNNTSAILTFMGDAPQKSQQHITSANVTIKYPRLRARLDPQIASGSPPVRSKRDRPHPKNPR